MKKRQTNDQVGFGRESKKVPRAAPALSFSSVELTGEMEAARRGQHCGGEGGGGLTRSIHATTASAGATSIPSLSWLTRNGDCSRASISNTALLICIHAHTPEHQVVGSSVFVALCAQKSNSDDGESGDSFRFLSSDPHPP